jgi:predicted transcriptional regulator
MSFLWFGKRREDVLNREIKSSFENIKGDINKIGSWIDHLHTRDGRHDEKISKLYDEILKIKEDVDGIKNFISFFDNQISNRVFKQPPTAVDKQTAVEGVQTRVQTPVQTPIFNAFLKNLSVSEKTIVWVVLNSEMKLSCEDISALLGKDKATVRGQLNSIKRKNDSLIMEQIELNGKKRYYVDPRIKDMIVNQLRAKTRAKKMKK